MRVDRGRYPGNPRRFSGVWGLIGTRLPRVFPVPGSRPQPLSCSTTCGPTRPRTSYAPSWRRSTSRASSPADGRLDRDRGFLFLPRRPVRDRPPKPYRGDGVADPLSGSGSRQGRPHPSIGHNETTGGLRHFRRRPPLGRGCCTPGVGPDGRELLASAVAKGTASVDLYWLPLGAGGHFVRLNGRAYEALMARIERRPACDLYHSALQVEVAEGTFVIEQTPVADLSGKQRGVVAGGAVGSRWAGRFRIFRYEIRLWRGGHIPDVAEAVDSPRRLTNDEGRCAARARRGRAGPDSGVGSR